MHNKKLPAYILLLLLVFILGGCGCSIETVEEHDSRLSQEAFERSSALNALSNGTKDSETSTTVPNYETAVSDVSADTTADESTDVSASSDQTVSDSRTSAFPTSPSASSETTSSKETAPLQDKTTEAQSAKATAVTSDKASAGESQTTTSLQTQTTAQYIMVHITITCSKVIDSPDLSTNAKLPEDGIILDTYVAVKDGDSVFTALKAAADDNGISLNYTGSKGSIYVAGISGLTEKQCGRYSGWKYSVNNVYPNVGCGGYTLSDGDSILFGYVATYTDTY